MDWSALNILKWGAVIIGILIIISFVNSLLPSGVVLFNPAIFVGVGAVMFMVIGLAWVETHFK